MASLEGKNIVSGQMEEEIGDGTELPFERIHALTGKSPALRGFDLALYSPDLPPNTSNNITQRAINWSQSNGIVHLMWHWYMRGSNGDIEVYANSPAEGGIFTDFDISKAVTRGTTENTRFIKGIDAIAVELKKLQSANVPVLWRPFHECSAKSFWWGTKGPEPLKKAWKIMFERLVGYHKINNLIWVFNPASATDISSWYPGDEYVDVISFDAYGTKGTHPTWANDYKVLKAFAGSRKMVTMTENGAIPDPSRLQTDQAKWTSFMTWDDQFSADPDWNSDDIIRQTYASGYVLSKDEIPHLATLAAPAVKPAEKLLFTSQPDSAFIGDSWQRPVYAGVVDSDGHIIRSRTGIITFKIGTSTHKLPLINGVAKLAPVFTTPATGLTVSASMSGFPTITSNGFNIGSATDSSKIGFENNAQGWTSNSTLAVSGTRAFAGIKSLQIAPTGVSSASETSLEFAIAPNTSAPPAGSTIQFRVWVPPMSNIHGMYVYAQEGAGTNWRFTTGGWVDREQLTAGTWNTLSVTVPGNAVPLYKIGINVFPATGQQLSGNLYLDSVTW